MPQPRKLNAVWRGDSGRIEQVRYRRARAGRVQRRLRKAVWFQPGRVRWRRKRRVIRSWTEGILGKGGRGWSGRVRRGQPMARRRVRARDRRRIVRSGIGGMRKGVGGKRGRVVASARLIGLRVRREGPAESSAGRSMCSHGRVSFHLICRSRKHVYRLRERWTAALLSLRLRSRVRSVRGHVGARWGYVRRAHLTRGRGIRYDAAWRRHHRLFLGIIDEVRGLAGGHVAHGLVVSSRVGVIVYSRVTSELVGSRETLRAPWKVAGVRLLAGMCSDVPRLVFQAVECLFA